MSVREKGFSLLELMVTLVILAILLGIGVPSFNSITQSSRLRSVVHDLNTAVQLARSEAVSRRETAAACRSNVTQTACGFGADWSSGWMVVVLTGNNLQVAADVQLVKVWDGIDITASGASNGFVFDRLGSAQIGASIDIDNGIDNRCLSTNISGRVLIQEVVCP